MKVAIVGSREFKNLQAVEDYINSLPIDTVIISGGSKGVDSVAEIIARKRGMITNIFPADWKNKGKGAGFIRNYDIIKACDKVAAFWDGISAGTKHTIVNAKKQGKSVEIYPDKEMTDEEAKALKEKYSENANRK